MMQLFIIFFSILLCVSTACASEEVWGYKKKDISELMQLVKEESQRQQIARVENTPKEEVSSDGDSSDVPQTEKQKEEIKPDYIAIPVLKDSMRVGEIISEDDLMMHDVLLRTIKDTTIMNKEELIGKQIRRSFSKEKPITPDLIGSPILVKRNQNVDIIFQKGALLISTNGRALAQGGAGERIKVMNLESKKIVTGKITANGDIDVTL